MTGAPILIVEDDRDIQDNLKFFLETEGFPVVSAMNGQEAIDYLRSGEPIRLILLDLMMPIMDGYEFLAATLRDEAIVLRRAPIVLVSAVPDIEKIARQYGLRYLKKPINLDRLLAAILATAPS